MTDGLNDEASELPPRLYGAFRLAAEGRLRREVARTRLEEATRQFAREARQAGASPEAMLVLLKRCLSASRLRLRRKDFPNVREHLVGIAIDAFYAVDEPQGRAD